MMGGGITLESEIGQGTSAHLAIMYELSNIIDTRPVPLLPVIALSPGQRNYRILIAEDLPENRLMLQNLLESVGYEVRLAINGVRALEIARTWQPDLVLMDMRMPVLDGYEATRRLKAEPDPPIVIAFSASAFVQQQREMYDAGCDDVLVKPFRVEE